MSTLVPELAVTPVATVTAESELRAFAVRHGISLRLDATPGAESSLNFGRDEAGGFVLSMTSDKTVEEALAFARLVITRGKAEAKVYAVAKALSNAEGGAPGFAELAEAFMHATLWKLNGASQFIRVVEEALAALRQETDALA